MAPKKQTDASEIPAGVLASSLLAQASGGREGEQRGNNGERGERGFSGGGKNLRFRKMTRRDQTSWEQRPIDGLGC